MALEKIKPNRAFYTAGRPAVVLKVSSKPQLQLKAAPPMAPATPKPTENTGGTVAVGGSKILKTEGNCRCSCHQTRDEVDKLLDAYSDVASPGFRAWYCGAIYAMGCQVFSDLAEQARGGKAPARYFSSLLKARLGGRLK